LKENIDPDYNVIDLFIEMLDIFEKKKWDEIKENT
jgi:hypothetical protein